MQLTEYYEEFKRYYDLASIQQINCNLGIREHSDVDIRDNLMQNVQLYDVVERKYAGFSQIINDIFYNTSDKHPYIRKIKANMASDERKFAISQWSGKKLSLETWLYIFLVHRITGSAINYAKIPSGYHNTILFNLNTCENIKDIKQKIKNYDKPFYTSVGYQFPQFPKKPINSSYKRSGDYYLCEYADILIYDLCDFITKKRRDFREIGEFMFNWNKSHGFNAFRFQYAAFLADIADWFPEYINRSSLFYYGTNAVECISYLAEKPKNVKKADHLDNIMIKIYEDLNSLPYNAEDVCCDFIRWVENYIKPGIHYDHLDRDAIWSSCKIKNHPMGRQKKMLELGLLDSFNNLNYHPSDNKILENNNLSVEDYKKLINSNL